MLINLKGAGMKNDKSKRTYPVVISLPDKDNFYLAYVPDIDRMTQGETLDEVLVMAKDLISIYAIALQDSGEMIPLPSKAEPKHEENQFVKWITVDFDCSCQ
jgi:predicted RNase H-like HicB family nuclease